MHRSVSAALSGAISKHIDLSAARRETLVWLVLLMVRHGTVCLWQLAAHVATLAQTDSVRRRFYRFFQFVPLDGSMVARVVVDLLGLSGKRWVLAMDRTNWEFGRARINILMVSVMWRGVGIPLIWTLLPSCGNSDMETRIDLLERLRQTFPNLKIASLTADREFIGDAWMEYLARRKIPFTMRLRYNQYVIRKGCPTIPIDSLARRLKPGKTMIVKERCRLGQKSDATSPEVRLVIMRLKTNELLALVCPGNPRKALARYRERWTIETMFANLKTRGFNMEDTRIIDPAKLTTLLAVIALAVALCAKTGVAVARLRPIRIKNHGRKACSLFSAGITALRKIFASPNQHHAINCMKNLCSPNLQNKPLKSAICLI